MMRQNAYDSFAKALRSLTILVVSAWGIVALQQQTLLNKNQAETKAQIQEAEKEQGLLLKVAKYAPTFGYSNLVADWTFLNFVQYFGDNAARNQLGYGLSPQFFQAVVEQDPRFVKAYLYLDPATTLFAGQPAISVKIMNQGTKSLSPRIPDSYLVWMYKAVDELLFLGNSQQAQKDYETAAQWSSFQNDEHSRSIGRRATETAQFLAKNPDSEKAQASSWLMILANAKDQKTMRIALDNIRRLGAEVKFEGNRVLVKFPEQD